MPLRVVARPIWLACRDDFGSEMLTGADWSRAEAEGRAEEEDTPPTAGSGGGVLGRALAGSAYESASDSCTLARTTNESGALGAVSAGPAAAASSRLKPCKTLHSAEAKVPSLPETAGLPASPLPRRNSYRRSTCESCSEAACHSGPPPSLSRLCNTSAISATPAS
eukprot:scaffold867_cov96-Isochrysis_galbana.AAC.2